MTEEHKRKISEAQKGRVFTPEHKLKLSIARRGREPWNIGIPRTPEEKLKISLANTGRSSWNRGLKGVCVAWNKGMHWSAHVRHKISAARMGKLVGPDHPNWRGGTKSERNRAMTSAQYQSWRSDVFERDGYRCYSCGEKGTRLEAHHIFPWASFPRLRFAIENGITLCKSCHLLIPPTLKSPDNFVAPAGMILAH